MKSEVFLMDCMDLMASYGDGHFDLAVCDVPYGINVGNMAFVSARNPAKQKNGTKLNLPAKKYAVNDFDRATPTQEYFNELRRVSKHQIVFGVEYVNWDGMGSGRIKWNKCVPEGVSFKGYELAYCSSIDYTHEIVLLWSGLCQAKSLSEPTTQQGNKRLNEKRIHPCHKPILLYDAIYRTFAASGMKVLDTHLGGGSNRISANKNNMEFTAAEIDVNYFHAQEKRFKQYKAQLKMFA